MFLDDLDKRHLGVGPKTFHGGQHFRQIQVVGAGIHGITHHQTPGVHYGKRRILVLGVGGFTIDADKLLIGGVHRFKTQLAFLGVGFGNAFYQIETVYGTQRIEAPDDDHVAAGGLLH